MELDVESGKSDSESGNGDAAIKWHASGAW